MPDSIRKPLKVLSLTALAVIALAPLSYMRAYAEWFYGLALLVIVISAVLYVYRDEQA